MDGLETGEARSVLLIGGAGYIGSVLARKLLDAGYQVRVLDKLVHGHASVRDLCQRPGFELVEGELQDLTSVVPAIKGVDAVIQLAIALSAPASSLDYEIAIDVNTTTGKTVQYACRDYGISRFLLISTYEVYQAQNGIIDEDSELGPLSLCARSVAGAERVTLSLLPNDPKPTVLRLATPFGLSQRMRFDLLINHLVARAVTEREIAIVNSQRWRPFIHVTDIARAIILCLQAPVELVRGGVYNVGDNRLSCTLVQLGDIITRLIPETKLVCQDRAPDLPSYQLSFSRIAHDLGFECLTSLDQGIDEVSRAVSGGHFDYHGGAMYGDAAALQDDIG